MTQPFSVELEGLEEIIAGLRPDETVQKPVREILTNASAVAEREARSKSPRDTGAIASSIKSEVRDMSAKVYSPLAYAKYVESGRKPGGGMPPPEALAGWIARHGFTGTPFVLARAIARRGIRGRFFEKKAASATKRQMNRILKDAAEGIELRWGRKARRR